MLYGLPTALFVMYSMAVRAPEPAGRNVTLTTQLAPEARLLGLRGQVVVLTKSVAFAPVKLMALIVSGVVPLFSTVTMPAPLVVLTTWLPKASRPGLTLTVVP